MTDWLNAWANTTQDTATSHMDRQDERARKAPHFQRPKQRVNPSPVERESMRKTLPPQDFEGDWEAHCKAIQRPVTVAVVLADGSVWPVMVGPSPKAQAWAAGLTEAIRRPSHARPQYRPALVLWGLAGTDPEVALL